MNSIGASHIERKGWVGIRTGSKDLHGPMKVCSTRMATQEQTMKLMFNDVYFADLGNLIFCRFGESYFLQIWGILFNLLHGPFFQLQVVYGGEGMRRVQEMVEIGEIPLQIHEIPQDQFSGWWFEPLWKIWTSIGMIIPNIWENKKCSKPPTSFGMIQSVQSPLFKS